MIPNKQTGIPRWAVEAYDGDYKDFTDWLHSQQYYQRWGDKIDALDTEDAQMKADAISKLDTLERTFQMNSIVDRSMAYQLYEASRTGWPHWLPVEYDSVTELLGNMLKDTPEDTSKFRDLRYLIEVVLPSLEANGVDPIKLLAMPERWSKTRVAIPAIRAALEEQQGDELVETVNGLLEKVADPKLGVREFREQMKKETYKKKGLECIEEATLVVASDGDTIVIRGLSRVQTKAVQLALDGLVDRWRLADMNEIVKELVDMYLGDKR